MNTEPSQGFAALVIDDDEFARKTTVRALVKLGASIVYEAENGARALAVLAGSAPVTLIICDLRMPEVDGVETLRRLAETNQQARIILASGVDPRVLRSAREMALGFGLVTVQTMPKPVTMAKLRQALAEPIPELFRRSGNPISESVTIDEIQRGLVGREFTAFYQPKISFAERRFIGAEALIRWRHPIYGVLSPIAFLSLVQEAGKLEQMTDFVLSTAISQCAAWDAQGISISISVNLPIISLLSRELPARIDKILATHRLAPDRLILEVTEDGWLQQEAVAREVLTRLRVNGIGLSIDDFGTGYSTYQQLLNAPFNELKLDQSFVSKAVLDAESRIILSSSIAMAHELKLDVVAEGIETMAQWELLATLGADAAQGYLAARPMPADQIPGWKARWDALDPSAALVMAG